MHRRVTLFIIVLLIGGTFAYGRWLTSPSVAARYGSQVHLAHLPDSVQGAERDVQVAYQYAIDNPTILEQIPCYCGCIQTLGHRHNLDCYITSYAADGSVEQYSDHALF